MNAVAPRDRVTAQCCSWFGIAVLAACSSVASVNEKAMLVAGPEVQAPAEPIDPLHLLRPNRTEYRIGPRDLLEIEIYELEEPTKSKLLKVRVSQDGSVLLPLIGNVPAAGSTALEVQQGITERLGKDFLVNPSVSVVVAEHQARRVTVLGSVKSPGTFRLQENSTTLVDVLALSGGPDDKAGSVVYVVHAEATADGAATTTAVAADASIGPPAPHADPKPPRLLKIDLHDLVERGDLSANCTLEDGDVVHVPPAAQFFVMGQVANGGAFPLRGDITLLRAIALAGGLKEEATPAATVLIRNSAKGRVTFPIDLNEVEAGSEKDLLMQPDDVLVVSESGADRFARGFSAFVRGLFTISYGLR
ncbi:MAG: polysaccharide biosynthesis/export family protein [Planctomycetes bacterium]|nr:polysaccharide biosynthesis/export family protein [Planctomycetota bacterium]